MPESGKRHLQALFDYSIDKGIKFFHKYNKYQCVPAPDMNLVSCLCHILAAFIEFMSKHGGFGSPGSFFELYYIWEFSKEKLKF